MTTTANTSGTAASALPAAGGSSSSTLSAWAGPYVTNMLGEAQAIADQPYQTYQGPMTAGASPLQTQGFQNISTLGTPSQFGTATTAAEKASTAAQNLAYSPTTTFGTTPISATGIASGYQAPNAYQEGTFSAGFNAPTPYQASTFTTGYTPGQFNTGLGAIGSVQSYMSPYQQNVIDIQAREARRQADIARQAEQTRLSQAGAYGGSRQAIMEAERQRNLGQQVGDIQERGLQSAYDRALAQRFQEAQLGLQAQQYGEQAKQFGTTTGLQAQEMGERSRQFGAQQALSAAQLASQFGLDAQKAQELSRQFGYGQKMSAAQLQAQFKLDAEKANQLANLQAQQSNQQTTMEAQRMAEQSKQFGANLGLQGIGQQLSAAQALGSLGAQKFGTELQGLNALLAAGAQQRGIEQEGITADYNEFLAQRDYPMKQTQYLQSMLQGLPISTVTNTPAQQSGLGQLTSTVGGLGSLIEALRGLGIGTPG